MRDINEGGESRKHDVADARMRPNSNPVVFLKVALGDQTQELRGREAFALHAIQSGGLVGITPIDYPAPRWSDYVFKLRRRGFDIETVDERHGGPFPGSHARYVLRSPVTVISAVRKNDRVAA